MKIVYYRENGNLKSGIFSDQGIVSIDDLDAVFTKKEQLEKRIASGEYSHVPFSGSGCEIVSCVSSPSKIICIGLNYRNHAAESGMTVPVVPVAFTKYNNTLTDYGSDVVLGPEGTEYDYEVELGVVIGKKCKAVSEEDALNYVLGYCVANDLSCRDLQFKTSQWLLGKSLDGFLPLGKYIVTADEVGDPQNLRLSCTVNGELRQNSSTADMIFSVAEIISFLSRYMTLEAGDLILTGTPEGVAMGMPEKKWLKPGDVVRVEIEKLGYTENRMIG